MVYDNKHRAFLQAIMNGGTVQDQVAKALCAKIFNNANVNMSSTISSINDKLSPIAMCLQSGMCEITGQKYWCVVGTTHEDSVTLLSEFSPAQRAFVRVVFFEIVNSDNGYITSTDCLNLVNNLEVKFLASDANLFLKRITKSKYLHYQNGVYYMGIKSIIELMPYFRATYQENFHKCFLCKEIMFHGHKCEHCNGDYHFYCISRKLAEQEGDKCPSCFKNMDCSEIEEFNNTQQQDETQDAEDEDEPMDVSDDVVSSQPISAPKKSKRSTRTKQ